MQSKIRVHTHTHTHTQRFKGLFARFSKIFMIGLCFYLLPSSAQADLYPIGRVASDSCGVGKIFTQWVGGLSQFWHVNGDINPNFITNLRYKGKNHIRLVDQDDNVIYSDSFDFDEFNIPIQNCAPQIKCGRLYFTDMMTPEEILVYHYVTEGVYTVYFWTEYRVYYNYYGFPMTPYDAVSGNPDVPAGSIEMISNLMSNPYIVDNVIINDQISEVGNVYSCYEENNIMFDLKASIIWEDFTELRTSWAEVTSCSDSIPSFSNAQLSNPRVLQIPTHPSGGIRYADSLFVGNITDTSFLIENPFIDETNLGKRYILRFELTNTQMCAGDTMVLEKCVAFTGEPIITSQFTLKTAEDPPYNSALVSAYQTPDLTNAPMLGFLGEEQIKFRFSTGIVDNAFIDIYLVDEDGDHLETMVEDWEKTFPNGINQYNFDYTVSLREIEIPSNTYVGWVYGSNTPSFFANNYFYYAVNTPHLYYKVVLRLVNGCGSTEEWSYFRVDQNFGYKRTLDIDDQTNPIEVFPNPFTDILQINGAEEGSSYEILNMQGVSLRAGVIESNVLNLQSLPSGQYLLKLTNEKGGVELKKVVKLR